MRSSNREPIATIRSDSYKQGGAGVRRLEERRPGSRFEGGVSQVSRKRGATRPHACGSGAALISLPPHAHLAYAPALPSSLRWCRLRGSACLGQPPQMPRPDPHTPRHLFLPRTLREPPHYKLLQRGGGQVAGDSLPCYHPTVYNAQVGMDHTDTHHCVQLARWTSSLPPLWGT